VKRQTLLAILVVVLGGLAPAWAQADDGVLLARAMLDAIQRSNSTAFRATVAENAVLYPSWKEEQDRNSTSLTLQGAQKAVRSCKLVTVRACGDDLAVVDWKCGNRRKTMDRYSHIRNENGKVTAMTADTAPLVCTVQR
jgi:hypothetical protein